MVQKLNNNDSHPVSLKIPFEIYESFEDLYIIEKRKGDRKLLKKDFMLQVIDKGIKSWLK